MTGQWSSKVLRIIVEALTEWKKMPKELRHSLHTNLLHSQIGSEEIAHQCSIFRAIQKELPLRQLAFHNFTTKEESELKVILGDSVVITSQGGARRTRLHTNGRDPTHL